MVPYFIWKWGSRAPIWGGPYFHLTTALINARNSAHDFSVKLSTSMCSYIGYSGWRNGWLMRYSVILDKDLATYVFWNLAIVTNAAICHDKLVNELIQARHKLKIIPLVIVKTKVSCCTTQLTVSHSHLHLYVLTNQEMHKIVLQPWLPRPAVQ